MKPKIGISIGDINGIGAEIIIKTFLDKKMLDVCTPIIYGHSNVIAHYLELLSIKDFKYHIISDTQNAQNGIVNIINCWQEEIPIRAGRATDTAGVCALKAIEICTKDTAEQKVDAMVTAPIHKKNISNQITFSGHTEYITQQVNAKESLMFMVSEQLRIGLVCNHIAINKVAQYITKANIIDKLKLMHYSLQNDFGISNPKIAVLGLNPHNGEEGIMGTEEQAIITPAIDMAKKKEVATFGPFSADGFFGAQIYLEFDGILAMYHDQGLIPFKTLSFGKGVNFTAGLPIVRTSPDHGTGFDIAGKNAANESSFKAALLSAINIKNNRG